MELGAQLYTVRMYTQSELDFARSMEKVAKIGYKTVQISAVGASVKPEAIRRICDANGLSIVLTHSNPDRILNDTDRLIEEHDRMGCKYIGLGMMPERYRTKEWLPYFVEDFHKPAEKMAKAGKLLMYHNHNLEFNKLDIDGTGKKYIMDYFCENFTPQEMGITLDTYWVQAAGCDVVQWIEKLSDRIPCVHLKDMEMTLNRSAVMAAVGNGNMNFPAILEAFSKTCCEHMLVEQDDCGGESPFVCLEQSYNYVKSLGY